MFAKADYNKAKDALQHEHQQRLNELEEALQSKDTRPGLEVSPVSLLPRANEDSEAGKAIQQLEEVIQAKDAQLNEQAGRLW